jgi:anti-sigma regulatory factor (Ser/Thr protein kinase)
VGTLRGTLRQPAHHRFRIGDEADAGALRRTAAGCADRLGAVPAARARAELVATELATNLVRHAKPGGWVLVRPLPPDGMEFLAVDHGPGIAEPAAALEGRSPAPGGLGRGLAAVRRASVLFDVDTGPGRGTTVLSRVDLGEGSAPARPDRGGVSVGVVDVCGDGWAVADVAGGLAVAVVDGLGHGVKASVATDAALDAFAADPADLDGLLGRANTAMRATRGAAMTACLLEPGRGELHYFAVGNVNGRVLTGPEERGLALSAGTLGLKATPPRARVLSHPWKPGATLVLWTDGLKSRLDLSARADLLTHHPALAAAALHRDHTRERDDATVVVIRHPEAA